MLLQQQQTKPMKDDIMLLILITKQLKRLEILGNVKDKSVKREIRENIVTGGMEKLKRLSEQSCEE